MVIWLLQVDAQAIADLSQCVLRYEPRFAALSAQLQVCLAGRNALFHCDLHHVITRAAIFHRRAVESWMKPFASSQQPKQ